MKRMNLRKSLGAVAVVGAMLVAAPALAQAPQGGGGPGYGMGPGMMGGGGPGYGMGPGMMGGGGPGYGMGPGMMGGGGPGYGMGPGMMGGYGFGPGSTLNLSDEQRGKIARIRGDMRRTQWELMGKMNDERAQMNELYFSDKRDDAALSKAYRKLSDLRQQMFDQSLAMHAQMEAVLTKEQREALKR